MFSWKPKPYERIALWHLFIHLSLWHGFDCIRTQTVKSISIWYESSLVVIHLGLWISGFPERLLKTGLRLSFEEELMSSWLNDTNTITRLLTGHLSICVFCRFPGQASEKMNSSMTALQAEKERLMRSVSEKEAELSSLRQTAQVQQSSLQQERDRSSREVVELQSKLQEKVSAGTATDRSLSSIQFTHGTKHQPGLSVLHLSIFLNCY